MGAMFSLVLAKLSALLGWVGDLFVAVFAAAWDFITDSFCWMFEQLMKIVVAGVSELNFDGLANYSTGATLPGEIINILGLLGIGTAITIISTAIVIRLGLQLIPFVRLGS